MNYFKIVKCSGILSLNTLNFNFFFKRNLNLKPILCNKNLKRQSKVLNKLFGARISGSRKWYTQPEKGSNFIKFGVPGTIQKHNNSKNNLRRINVLNKLFMSYITDLMATGFISEFISGKGVQVTNVKITSDFQHLHVLWTCKDNVTEIDSILNKHAGKLRHELCQLRVIGEVPNIKFIRDKTNENLETISELLKHINIQEEEEEDINEIATEEQLQLEEIKMTQNSFNLDRQEIMNKIRTKLKKSKEAWEIHKTNLDSHS